VMFFYCISGFFLLYPSPTVYSCFCGWVIVTQYTCQITFTSNPDFVASVSRVKGPASSKALPLHTFIIINYLKNYNLLWPIFWLACQETIGLIGLFRHFFFLVNRIFVGVPLPFLRYFFFLYHCNFV
jgi:hypothetical protein